jgi:hypothetical protein
LGGVNERERYETFLPFQHGREKAPPVTHVRSTLLSASLQGLRSFGWESRYFAALPKELHPVMTSIVAGSWTPIDIAFAHYTACDRMNLSTEEMARIGAEVSLRTQKTFVGTLGKAIASAGATPWHLLGHAHRIWGRVLDGGDQCVYKAGPKEAVVEACCDPLLRLTYFRAAHSAYYRVLCGLVAGSVFVRDVPKLRGEAAIGFRLSWV